MILHAERIVQTIDGSHRARFDKELLVAKGRVPLSVVRKRLAAPEGGQLGPVLLIHGFGQNRYAWHLPSRSFANYLAWRGFDVFNLDLRGHGRSRALGSRLGHTVDDYIQEDLPRAVDEVLAQTGGRAPFLVGHSLGGLVSYASAPSLEGGVRGIVSVGSPYHFTKGSLPLRSLAWMTRGLFAVRLRPRHVPVSVKPIGRMLSRAWRFAESPFAPLPFRGWHKGALEPHVLEEHMQFAFDAAGIGELVNMFEWAHDERFGGHARDYAARFEALDLPLLVVAGENDDLAPADSVRPGFVASRSSDKSYRAFPLGHIDLLVGRDAPRSTWTSIGSWLERRAA